MGYRACKGASGEALETGNVGAGTGATVGKLLGPRRAMKSGIGSASVRVGDVTVGAVIVVNAMGDVVRPGGTVVAGARKDAGDTGGSEPAGDPSPFGNTTIGVIATDAVLTSEQSNHLASVGHDGLARTIEPVHTLYDGDTLFALATGEVEVLEPSGLVALDIATVSAVEQAVLDAVLAARAAGGLPAAFDSSRDLG
jgi:L-aminopeptidase/D-esterase-like protein